MKLSEQHEKVSAAIVTAWSKLKNPPFDSKNPFLHNDYVSLAGVRDHVHPVLAEVGLAVVQSCAPAGELVVCTTTLLHSSGQWAEAEMVCAPVMPEKRKDLEAGAPARRSTAQDWAAASTYARRYGLLAIMGIVGDVDDDGNTRGPGHGIPEGAWDSKPQAQRPAAQRQLTPEDIAEREAMAKRVAEVRAKEAQAKAQAGGVTRETVDPDTGVITEETEPRTTAPASRPAAGTPGPARPAGKGARSAAGF